MRKATHETNRAVSAQARVCIIYDTAISCTLTSSSMVSTIKSTCRSKMRNLDARMPKAFSTTAMFNDEFLNIVLLVL